MITVILPWTNGIMIKTGDWLKTREKNIEKKKQTKNKEVYLSCCHYLKQVVKKAIAIFNLIVCVNIFLYLCNFIFETQN